MRVEIQPSLRQVASPFGTSRVRAYLLQLMEKRRLSASSYNVYAAALCFLYRQTLRRPEVVQGVQRLRVWRKLPTLPTRDEIERVFEQLPLHMRTIAVLAYGSGLRVSEICQLRVQDIDSSRMQVHVERSKAGKQRRALLSHAGLALLRSYYKSYKVTGPLLFPGRNRHKALSRAAFNKALVQAVQRAKVRRVWPHSLRHAFATCQGYIPLRATFRTRHTQLCQGKVEMSGFWQHRNVGLGG
jgi:integrase/recombinase XerD